MSDGLNNVIPIELTHVFIPLEQSLGLVLQLLQVDRPFEFVITKPRILHRLKHLTLRIYSQIARFHKLIFLPVPLYLIPRPLQTEEQLEVVLQIVNQ